MNHMIPMPGYQQLSFHLAYWLEARLPESANCWSDFVLPHLTASQAMWAGRNRRDDLMGLDLAALLKVALGNWSEIAALEGYPESIRSLLLWAIKARNELAHERVDRPPTRHQLAYYAEVSRALVSFLQHDLTIERPAA